MNKDLADLLPVAHYCDERKHIFPTSASMSWFFRHHKHQLIQARALLLIGGRWFAAPSAFDEYVLAMGLEQAQKRGSRRMRE